MFDLPSTTCCLSQEVFHSTSRSSQPSTSFLVTMMFVSFISTFAQPIQQFLGSILASITTWRLIVDTIANLLMSLLDIIQHHSSALVAPVIWIFLAISIFWLQPPLTPPLPAPNEPSTRQRHRISTLAERRERRRKSLSERRSIRTEGFHRKYPLDLRAMGRFIRRPPPMPQHRYVGNDFGQHDKFDPPWTIQEILSLKNQVRELTKDVRTLQLISNGGPRTSRGIVTSPITNLHVRRTTYPTTRERQPPANQTTRRVPHPNVTREGDTRHDEHTDSGWNPNSQVRRTPNRHNRSHPRANPVRTNAATINGTPLQWRSQRQPTTAPSTVDTDLGWNRHSENIIRTPTQHYRNHRTNNNLARPSPVQSQPPDRRPNIARHVANMAQIAVSNVTPALRAALQAPSRFRSVLNSKATFSVIWDSGASVTISPNKNRLCWTNQQTKHSYTVERHCERTKNRRSRTSQVVVPRRSRQSSNIDSTSILCPQSASSLAIHDKLASKLRKRNDQNRSSSIDAKRNRRKSRTFRNHRSSQP